MDMRILSLYFGVEKSSIAVTVMEVSNKSINDADEKRNIIKYVLMRNANVPSNDLLNNRVVPYFIPMRAAAESDKLMTRRAITATFSLNRYAVSPAPINTQDAPDNT